MVESRLPSPKSHIQLTMPEPFPLDVFVKLMVVGKQLSALSTLKSAVGAGFTLMVTVTGVLVPLAFVAVNVTVYIPALENKAAAFGEILVAGVTSGGTPPKSHKILPPFEAVPLKETARGAQPEVGLTEVMITTGTCPYPLQ